MTYVRGLSEHWLQDPQNNGNMLHGDCMILTMEFIAYFWQTRVVDFCLWSAIRLFHWPLIRWSNAPKRALEVVLIPGGADSRRDSEGERCPRDLASVLFLLNERMQQNSNEFDQPCGMRPYFGHRSDVLKQPLLCQGQCFQFLEGFYVDFKSYNSWSLLTWALYFLFGRFSSFAPCASL